MILFYSGDDYATLNNPEKELEDPPRYAFVLVVGQRLLLLET